MAIQTNIADMPQTDLNKFLCFLLLDKIYAVSILQVKEIIEYMEVTPIPMMPDFFLGTINLRGRGVPVVDLRTRLDMDQGDIGKRTCIIIMEVNLDNNDCTYVGILVDAVSQVADIKQENIEDAPSFGGNLPMEFIRGIGKVDEKFVVVLNIDELLSLKDLKIISEVNSTNNLDQVADSNMADKVEISQED